MRVEGREVALGVGPSRVGPVYRPCPASGLVDDKTQLLMKLCELACKDYVSHGVSWLENPEVERSRHAPATQRRREITRDS